MVFKMITLTSKGQYRLEQQEAAYHALHRQLGYFPKADFGAGEIAFPEAIRTDGQIKFSEDKSMSLKTLEKIAKGYNLKIK